MSDLTIEYVDPTELIQHPENPRRGNVEAIAESLLASGQYKPLVVSLETNHVVAGNHTLQAVLLLRSGWRPEDHDGSDFDTSTVAIVYRDLDAAGERRILAVDNRTSDLGTYDNMALVALLDSLDTLDGSGYSADDLDTLRFLTGQQGTEDLETGGATDAHYNQNPEQAAEHEKNVQGYQPLGARGLEEVIIVLPTSKKDQLIEWIQRLRGRWGIELTNGDIIYKAVAEQIEE